MIFSASPQTAVSSCQSFWQQVYTFKITIHTNDFLSESIFMILFWVIKFYFGVYQIGLV
jgi:hypothetical protein